MTDTRANAISALLDPRSIAIVGASENAARIGGRPLRYLRESGFKGAVYPVNPNRDNVQGFKAYGSVASLPETPDVAILAVPAAATIQAVRECAERGVSSAIVFSAGFAETSDEGRVMQDEMANIARESKMRILGPNCLGVFNARANYYGTFSAILDTGLISPGPVSVVSQSGAYGSHITHLARQRGLGISHWVTTGNECDIDVAEALRWVVDQDGVNVVMAYAEGIRNRDAFIDALETARQRETAIVFMKVGRSEVGAHAVSSHTAALAGSDAVFDAVLRQYGVHRARTTAEQLDIAYAASRGIFPRSGKLGIFTLSGGFGIQMADDAADAGLEVSPMPEAAQGELKEILPYASPVNPVDATAQALTELPVMTRFIRTMLDKGGYDMFTGIFGSGPASPTFGPMLRKALEDALSDKDDVIKCLTMSAPSEVMRSYEEKGFLVYEDGTALTHALGALVRFRQNFDLAKAAGAKLDTPTPASIPGRAITEHDAKSILSKAGIAFTPEKLVTPEADPGPVADQLGYPLVMKISSPDLPHKTEVGGVALSLKSADEVRAAMSAMLARVKAKAPEARIEGVILTPMLTGGVETIAGTFTDPTMGPVVMFGLGGVFVEVLKDVTFRVAPFDKEEAHRMIREIRGFAMLEGVRGAPPADLDALADLLSRLSVFAHANAEKIDSIDLNPVLAMPKGRGAVPLDALIVAAGAAENHKAVA